MDVQVMWIDVIGFYLGTGTGLETPGGSTIRLCWDPKGQMICKGCFSHFLHVKKKQHFCR
jgi:hypothetical protein